MNVRNIRPIHLLLVLLLALVVRATILLGSTNRSGPSDIVTQVLGPWATIAQRLIGIDQTRLSARSPRDQANFWLATAATIPQKAQSAPVLHGLAWVLDAPQSGFIGRHIKSVKSFDFPGERRFVNYDYDREAIKEELLLFADATNAQCLNSIDRAAKLDPQNKSVWRAKGFLQFHHNFWIKTTPRNVHWLGNLEDCSLHDPDNALYDYLAARQLWANSITAGRDTGRAVVITDQESFNQAVECFRRGQSKPYLDFDTESLTAIESFIRAAQVEIGLLTTGGNPHDLHVSKFLMALMRQQGDFYHDHQRREDFTSGNRVLREMLRLADQLPTVDDNGFINWHRWHWQRFALANLIQLGEAQPNLVSAEESTRFRQELSVCRGRLNGHTQAGREQQQLQKANKPRVAFVVAKFTAELSQQFFLASVALSAGCWLLCQLLARRRTNSPTTEWNWLTGWYAWLLGIAISFLLIAVFPTRLLDSPIEQGLIAGTLWIALAILACMALKVIHRRTAAPRTQLGLLAAVLLVSVCGFLHLETVSDVAFSLFINGSAVGTISMIGALLLMLLLTAGAYRSVTSSNKAAAYSKLLVVLQLGLWSVLVYVPATAIANGWLPAQIESVVCWRSMNEQPLSPLGMAHALVEQGHIERPARWLLALAYWQLQFGVLASCGIAAAIVLATSVGRRSLSGETTNPVAFLEAAGSWAHVASHTLCRSSVTVATISFLLYLLFVPVVSGTGSFGH